MASRRAHFRQADVTRALRAAHAAGVNDVRVEIEPTGRMVIVTGKAAGGGNSFDELMGGRT